MASGPRGTSAGDRQSAATIDLPRAERHMAPKDAAPALAPPFPPPLERKPALPKLLRILWRNPLEAWTRAHFEEMIVLDRSIFGEIAIVNDPGAIRRVLSDNAENYPKGALQHRVLGAALRNGLLLSEDRQWRDQRRVLAPAFSPRTVTDFAPAMRAAIDDMVARWKRLGDGALIDMAAEMAALTLDVLTRTIFPDGFGGDRDAMRENMRRFFDNVGRIDALDLLGAPEFLPRIGHWKSRKAEAFFDRAVRELLDARRKRLGTDPGSAPRDLLTLMLSARNAHGEFGLSDAEIRANLITFISAGHETTANALTWSLYLLTQSDGWRALVLEEARAAADAAALIRTRAVVEEALRLYPPLVAISREAAEADELAGARLGKGAMVVIAPYLLHRHRKLWERPDAFDPSRFLPEARASVPRYSYLPFGDGPRICIGAAFALQEATLALAAIIRNFRFSPLPGHKVWPLQRVTLRPAGGLPMRIRARRD